MSESAIGDLIQEREKLARSVVSCLAKIARQEKLHIQHRAQARNEAFAEFH
jgi:hypothetical protein